MQLCAQRNNNVGQTTIIGAEIAAIQKEGKLVPSEITVELIKKAIEADLAAPGYLIDGFPRNIIQADMFEDSICRAESILNLDADEAGLQYIAKLISVFFLKKKFDCVKL